MLKKKSSVTAPKLAKHEVSLVHNNPMFSASTAIHVNPLFEPLKSVTEPEDEYSTSAAASAAAAGQGGECIYEEEGEQRLEGGQDDSLMWYHVSGTKVEVKMEDEGAYVESGHGSLEQHFSQQELWNQPHNDVLKRELRRHRDDKQNYSYPMMTGGKMTAPPLYLPDDNRSSIYISPRRSLPILPKSFFEGSSAAGSSAVGGQSSFAVDASGKKRVRDSTTSDAARSGHGLGFKCLMPGCAMTFSDAFTLSEHCAQHSFDFKEYIKKNEEEYLKRTRTL